MERRDLTTYFLHRYQLYIAFYYSYVNPFTINPSGARIKKVDKNSSYLQIFWYVIIQKIIKKRKEK